MVAGGVLSSRIAVAEGAAKPSACYLILKDFHDSVQLSP